MSNKAYLNALAEEGTRGELIEWLRKLDAENDRLRELIDDVRKFAKAKADDTYSPGDYYEGQSAAGREVLEIIDDAHKSF